MKISETSEGNAKTRYMIDFRSCGSCASLPRLRDTGANIFTTKQLSSDRLADQRNRYLFVVRQVIIKLATKMPVSDSLEAQIFNLCKTF